MKRKTKIVVLGAGYAGMMAALRLSGKTHKLNAEIILINDVDSFVERPRLHQAATGQTISEKSLHDMLKGSRVQFQHGRVVALHPGTHSIMVQITEDFRSF